MFAWLKALTASLSTINALFDVLKLAFLAIREWMKNREIERKKKEINDAAERLKRATTAKEKTDALCELEKKMDPDSDCDRSKPRDGGLS